MSALNTQTLSEISTLQVIDNHITVKESAKITGYNIQYLRRLLSPCPPSMQQHTPCQAHANSKLGQRTAV